MALLIYSKNGSVRQKWFSALKDAWQVYQASSFKELLVLLKRLPVETILVHRGAVGTTELREIFAQNCGSKVFVFADRPTDQEGLTCLQLGCIGYTNTYIAPLRLKAAIEAVNSGLVWVGSSLMQHLIKGLAANDEVDEGLNKPSSPLLIGLSNREYELAYLVAEGLPNNDIAVRMNISERTVKAHLSSIYSKTQTKGRLNLALLMKKVSVT